MVSRGFFIVRPKAVVTGLGSNYMSVLYDIGVAQSL
jgi:hypothetical protein